MSSDMSQTLKLGVVGKERGLVRVHYEGTYPGTQ